MRKLTSMYQKGGAERRKALEACVNWGHRDTLRILRIGLRDQDSHVALLAAKGIEKFRGRTTVSGQDSVTTVDTKKKTRRP